MSWIKMKGCVGEDYGVQDYGNPGELYTAMHILALAQWRFFSQGWKWTNAGKRLEVRSSCLHGTRGKC